MSDSFRMTLRRGPTPGKIYELVKDVVTVGRDVTNDIVINDAEVSRHHARLIRQGNAYAVEDLGSTNGTFVNNSRLVSQRTLSTGDVVGMGETVALSYEGAPVDSGATVVGNVTPTMVGNLPQPQFAQPPDPVYTPSAPNNYNYAPPAERSPAGAGNRRGLAIGCGCLTACLCFGVIAGALYYIDANNLYCAIAPFVCP